MAANLSNEIADTDKLTQYIGEARSMGLKLLPPDINYSTTMFSVSEGSIVYGLVGIKGVGEGVAQAIESERSETGKFASFVDFLSRMSQSGLNRKVLESLVMAGCFDSLGNRRKELMLNMDRVMEWVAAKNEYESSRQGSLFDSGDETVFPPFQMDTSEEFDRQEMLDSEKALLGFYFTGHPMDEFKGLWERSSTIDLAHPERATQDREYIVVVMMKEFREIMTKAGRRMAFGLVEDFSGSIEIVVFPDILEQLRDKLAVDRVYCMKGTFDAARGKPCLQLKELLDPVSLKERSWKELHIRLAPPSKAQTSYAEDDMNKLRDMLFSLHGSCVPYFHIPLADSKQEAIVGVGAHVTCSALDTDVEFLKSHPLVSEVWRN
jgi:DNA polymerase-3 subunit alpha